MTPNVHVEVYDPRVEGGVKTLAYRCGSFDVDAGTLVMYSDTDNRQPTAVWATGEWRNIEWL